MHFREQRLSSKKTQFGFKLRKCSDNDCKKSVIRYNTLCAKCRRKHRIQSEEHMKLIIAKDATFKKFDKHLIHLIKRQTY